MTSTEFQEMLRRAHYSEVAERYQEMAAEMKEVLKVCHEEGLDVDVTIRNLFSLAYKNILSARRSSWRILCTERGRLEENSIDIPIIDELIAKVEEELFACCDEALGIIERYKLAVPDPSNPARSVFFLKMCGDYWRYKAEVAKGPERETIVEAALANYVKGYGIAVESLEAQDSIRLGLMLNYSVFIYEIQNNHEQATKIANEAFHAAISLVSNNSGEQYKDSSLILQLLRDNMTLWSSPVAKRDYGHVAVEEVSPNGA